MAKVTMPVWVAAGNIRLALHPNDVATAQRNGVNVRPLGFHELCDELDYIISLPIGVPDGYEPEMECDCG